MSHNMPDGDFEYLSDDECRNLEQLLNDADGRIAIFDNGLFDYRENEEDKKVLFARLTWITRLTCSETTTIH